MEDAIEQQGRKPERGIRFRVPYAIATLRAEPQGEAWSYGDMVDLLAINHWRDEMATPIRLLYPMDLGPPPEGHESAIRVCLPADKAEAVINELLRVCNQ